MPRKIHLDRATKAQRVRKGRKEESRNGKRAYRIACKSSYTQ